MQKKKTYRNEGVIGVTMNSHTILLKVRTADEEDWLIDAFSMEEGSSQILLHGETHVYILELKSCLTILWNYVAHDNDKKLKH